MKSGFPILLLTVLATLAPLRAEPPEDEHPRIDPALENARLWKKTLLEWRDAAGLGNPLGD